MLLVCVPMLILLLEKTHVHNSYTQYWDTAGGNRGGWHFSFRFVCLWWFGWICKTVESGRLSYCRGCKDKARGICEWYLLRRKPTSGGSGTRTQVRAMGTSAESSQWDCSSVTSTKFTWPINSNMAVECKVCNYVKYYFFKQPLLHNKISLSL